MMRFLGKRDLVGQRDKDWGLRIVVLGGGFAGMEATLTLTRELKRDRSVEITLVSQQNHLLFTPLLPQVASSFIEPRHIVQSIRDIRGKRRFRFLRGTVVDIDPEAKVVRTELQTIPYDYLIIALGSKNNYFGVPGAEANTFPFKTLDDAVVLRRHLIDLFEHADSETDPGVKRRLLTFVVVGGGYTGVELVAEINDFIRRYAVKKYRGIHSDDTKLLLVESDSEILKGVDPSLASRAMKKLRGENIEVRTSAPVTRCSSGGLEIDGHAIIPAGMVIWAAGVRSNPVLEATVFVRDRLGRLVVDPYLRVKGYPEVYAVGDNAFLEGAPPAKASRPIIPLALHQGRRAAENVAAALMVKELRPADYTPKGYLVSLGMNDAVLKVGRIKLHGYFAWLIWNAYHLFKLVGFKKQIQVVVDWWLTTFFSRDGAILAYPERCRRCEGGAENQREAGRVTVAVNTEIPL